MMTLLAIKIITILIGLICLGFIVYWAICFIQGDCKFYINKNKMSPIKVESMSDNHALLTFTVPITNKGKQNGTIMDAFIRTYVPFEQYDEAFFSTLLTDKEMPRHDGYWQACIVSKGASKKLLCKIIIQGKSGNILRDLETIPDIPLEIIYQAVGRSDYYYEKEMINITSEEIRTAVYSYTSEVK